MTTKFEGDWIADENSDVNADHLIDLKEHPETQPIVKVIAQKLQLIESKRWRHLSARILQVASYSKQLVELAFDCFNKRSKGKNTMRRFSKYYNKLK